MAAIPGMRYQTPNGGSCILPSVKDLLHGSSHHQQQPHPQETFNRGAVCPKCTGRDKTGTLRPGEVCSQCRATDTMQHNDSHVQLRAGYSLHVNTQSPTHQYPAAQTPGPSPLTSSFPSPAYTFQPQNQYVMSHAGPPMVGYQHVPHPHEVYTSRQRLHSTVSNISAVSSNSNGNSQPLTAARIASNDRHKLSEKHRRDGMGAYVLAGHVLRSGLPASTLFPCQICMSSSSTTASSENQIPTPASSFSSSMSASSGTDLKPKIPKNDMLHDSLLWEFNLLLHLCHRDKVLEKVEGVRALALQMEGEKEQGMRNDWARRKKWSADVRGEVLLGVVGSMEAALREHGFLAENIDNDLGNRASGLKRPRDNEEEDSSDESRYGKRREADVPTPPSSRGSPVL